MYADNIIHSCMPIRLWVCNKHIICYIRGVKIYGPVGYI